MASAFRKLIVQQIDLDEISVPAGRRSVDRDAVGRLAESIKQIGLQTPITLRRVESINEDGEIEEQWLLVTGRHRLEAAKSLGLKYVDAVFMDGDEIDAELWEIAENLHRADLSKDQRDEHIRRYVQLLEKKEQSAKPRQSARLSVVGGRGHKSIARKVAEQTGVSVETVKRATGRKPKVVKVADEPLNEEEACERQVAALMAAWNKASADAREQFLARIDRPLMDRRFA